MRSRILIALGLASLLASSVLGQEPAGTVSILTAHDYAQIEMLYGRYNMGRDSGADGGYAFARTFTSDGELVSPGGRTVGHDDLARLAAETEGGLRHWTSNLMIEPSVGGATGWGYVRGVDVYEAGAGFGGLYHDVIVKTSDGWRFKQRTFVPGHGILDLGATVPIEVVRARPESIRTGSVTALDYAEVKRVVGQYNLAYDSTRVSDDGALMGLAFTPDAIFEQGDTNRTGREAIVERYRSNSLGIHHWVSNLLIGVSPEGLESWSYVGLFTVDDDGAVLQEVGGGILRERYERTAEGWQVSYRRYDASGSTPEIAWPSLEADRFTEAFGAASDDAASPELSGRDYAEIEQLYWRYNVAFDSAATGGRAFARTFVPDGEFVTATGTVTGHDALAGRAAANSSGLHSWMSNLVVEPSPEGAIGRAYIMTADLTGGSVRSPSGPRLTGAVVSHDELVRTPDGWLFKTRRYARGFGDLGQVGPD
jgi:hypothetical protein